MVLAGCRAQGLGLEPAAFAPPQGLRLASEHYGGSHLTGPLLQHNAAEDSELNARDAGSALALRVRLVYLRDAFVEDLPLLETSSRLVAAADEAQPVVASTQLGRNGHVTTGETARDLFSKIEYAVYGEVAPVADERFALSADTSAQLIARKVEVVPDSQNFLREYADRGPVQKSVGLVVARRPVEAGSGLSLALILSDLALPQEGALTQGTRPGSKVPITETIVLKNELVTGEPVLITCETPFITGAGETFCFFIEAEVAPEAGQPDFEAHVAAFERCADEINVGSARMTADLAWSPSSGDSRALMQAASSLDPQQPSRQTLLYLTERAHAPLATDLVIIAEDVFLTSYVSAVAGELKPALFDEPEQLGALLESKAYEYLAKSLMAGTTSPEMQALLLRHAGEAGRYAGILEDAAGQPSLAALDAFLMNENMIFLEDANPASRVRAFDWLAARGPTPPAYDPLAPAGERRAALRAAEEGARESAAAAQATEAEASKQ